jgi:hypothetical protein
MSAPALVTDKDRLRALEKDIRAGIETFRITGMRLKEIRDKRLYRADGFATWEGYCRERWEWSAERARQLIVASEYRAVLPPPPDISLAPTNCWTEGTVRELTRLGSTSDAARVADKVVRALEQSKAPGGKLKGMKLTQSLVRKFVDEDLGVDSAAQAKRRREESKPVLPDYLCDLLGRVLEATKGLKAVNKDGWDHLNRADPYIVLNLLVACETLARLLGLHKSD